jgi:hypothetical protein
MFVPLAEWLPDLPAMNNPGATVATNVIPYINSYAPFQSPVVYSNALTARSRGSIALRDNAGTAFNFSGDASKLYRMVSAAWSDVSKVGGYVTSSEEMWEFAKYGDTLIATNYSDTPQTWTLGTSSAFADLAGTPPKARCVASVRDFVMMGNTNDASGIRANAVRWCAINTPTTWTIGTSQADSQVLPNAGYVRKIVGGEYAVILCENSIYRATYVGTPLIFQFDEVEPNRGCVSQGSVSNIGNSIFYLSDEGFYLFNGNTSIPIGANKVDKYFWDDVDQNYLYRITSVIDPINKIVFWSYPGAGASSGTPNKILAYNWQVQKWALIEQEAEIICRSMTEGYTLETIDALIGNPDTGSYADVSVDSRQFSGGKFILSCFDTAHKLANFTGAAKVATIETAEAQLSDGARSLVTNVRPMYEGAATVTVSIGTRDTPSEAITYSTAASQNTEGECNLFAEGRYHRAKMTTSGEFTHLYGVEFSAKRRGKY